MSVSGGGEKVPKPAAAAPESSPSPDHANEESSAPEQEVLCYRAGVRHVLSPPQTTRRCLEEAEPERDRMMLPSVSL